MAYNPVNHADISSYRNYMFTVSELSGGYNAAGKVAADNQVSQIENMYFQDGNIISRGGLSRVGEKITGTFHSILREEFCGSILFHCGTSIYRFDGVKDEQVKTQLPDESSLFLRMNGKAYLYLKSGKIYEIENDFSCTEKEAYIPLIIENANQALSSYDVCEPLNMMTRRVKCSFNIVDGIAAKIYKVPYDIDEDYPIDIYMDGEEIDVCYASRTDKKRIIVNGNDTGLDMGDEITFEYTIKDEDDDFDEYFAKIFGCTIAFTYGGTSKDGTRAFFTGNDDYPGMYFRSELKNPLYFPDTASDTLGDGSEKVTGAEKRYEKMYFFTEKHVYAMSYEFSADNGASFDVVQVNTGIGCNMKNTVQAVDNTLVFGNYESGIYLLQSTEIFEELNVRHISVNLNGKNGGGFFNEAGAVYSSCDIDRKYFIFDGNLLYMWDYGRTPYYENGDLRKAEERLAWYIFSGFDGCISLFSLKNKLYFLRGSDETEIMLYNSAIAEDTEFDDDGNTVNVPVKSCFMTKNYNFGDSYSGVRKRLLHFAFDYEFFENLKADITINFYGDGEKFYTFHPELPLRSGRIKLRLPPYYARSFAVEFSFISGRTGISELAFYWQPSERIKDNM